MLAKKTLFRVIILACFAVAGLLGLIIQLIFLNAGDGTWISPYVTGVWISSLMSFFAIHGLFSIRDDFVNSEHKIEMTNMLIRNSTFRFALYSSVSFFPHCFPLAILLVIEMTVAYGLFLLLHCSCSTRGAHFSRGLHFRA